MFSDVAPASIPEGQHSTFRQRAGQINPLDLIEAARQELEEFVHVLEGEGVTVRRPDALRHDQQYSTGSWASSGMYAAMPRDVLMVVGEQIIECPMAWRSRYFESFAYRSLVKEYFHGGAKWTAGPKPELTDAQYDPGWMDDAERSAGGLVLTEYEPTFDAADFIRLGRDIVGQKSNVTNDFGIEWLRRCLGDEYRVHVLEFNDSHPMHIDATLLPLAPGKLLINPERVPEVPKIFSGWDVIEAPVPVIPDSHPLYMTSKWINMNIFSIDEHRVVVEAQDAPMIKLLKDVGCTPIACNFRNFNSFGGSFHCATLDVRRAGPLESYLD